MNRLDYDTRTIIGVALTMAALVAALTFALTAEPARSQPAPTPGVGYTHADLIDTTRNQPVPMDWFYPITDTTALTPAVFQFSDGAGNSYGGHPMTDIHEGGADLIPGPIAWIVFSHGTAGHGIQNLSMYRELAKRGYGIATPTHRGNSLIDVGLGLPIDNFPTTINKRNLDMMFTVNITTDLFNSTGKVKMIDGDPVVAAIGHSLGAMDAIGQATGLNAYLLPDARIDAVVGISSSVYLWEPVSGMDSSNILGSLNKPTLLIDQRADGITPSQYTDRVQAEIMNPDMLPTPLVDRLNLWGARHNATTDVLDLKISLDASTAPAPAKNAVTGLAQEVCAPTVDCVPRVHHRQTQTIAGFLDDNLPQ